MKVEARSPKRRLSSPPPSETESSANEHPKQNIPIVDYEGMGDIAELPEERLVDNVSIKHIAN